MKGRYLPGYGSKYLLKEDGRLYYMDRGGDYRLVGVSSDGRVRLYHRGKESRVSLRALYRRVWEDEAPPGTGEEPIDNLAKTLRNDEKEERIERLGELLDGVKTWESEPWND